MKQVISLVALGAALLSSPAQADELDDALHAYTAAGQKIVDMVNANQVDQQAVADNVLTAVKSGVVLARAYIAKQPAGKNMIDISISNAAKLDASGAVIGIGPMGDLSFADIESEWHDTGYFTTHDAGIDMQDEENEHFTDPLHTIVHPVMVLAAAKDYAKNNNPESLKAMKAEMQEGMEQAENTIKGGR